MTTCLKLSCGLLLAAAALLLLAVISMPPVIPTLHAESHNEADSIRQCNNIIQIWLNKNCERLNVLKRLDDGRVGDHVVQPCKRGLLEVTAFFYGDATLEETISILVSKGCTQVWP